MSRLTFLVSAFLVLIATSVSAVLSVQDFSCNGGLSSVQASVPFTCAANILNDDAQTDASLSTVSLSSLDGWTSASSYAGTFSGNSVPRASSVSVTFSNIVASTPGTGQTFTDILINGGSGNSAKLADAPLNVVAIKSTAISTSASTVAYAGTFSVVASIDLGGQASVTQEIGLSGCSLNAGQSTSRNYGVVADAQQSTSWQVTQDSGSGSTCTVTVETTASSDPVSLTDTKTAAVTGSGSTPTPTPTPVPSSGTPSSTTGSTTSGTSGAPGGGSSGTSGGTGSSGGGGGNKDLIRFYGLPSEDLFLLPGQEVSYEVILSSFYTGFINYVNITVTGIPEEWVRTSGLKILTPISNSTFALVLSIPEGATGTYDVQIEVSGIGTKSFGVIKAKKTFRLVLPSAVLPENQPIAGKVPSDVSFPSATARPVEASVSDQTNYSLVFLVIILALGAFAIHAYLTGRFNATTSSKETESTGQSEDKEPEKTEKSRKKGKKT